MVTKLNGVFFVVVFLFQNRCLQFSYFMYSISFDSNLDVILKFVFVLYSGRHQPPNRGADPDEV